MLIASRASSAEFPTGMFTVAITAIGDLRKQASLPKEETGQVESDVEQSKWTFEIVDYDYDPDDDDDVDWNGHQIDQYFTFFTTYRDSGKTLDTYLAKNGNVFPFLTALLGREPTRDDQLDVVSFVGRKLLVHIGPSKTGKAKISSPVAVKVKKKKEPAPEVQASIDADDDSPFDKEDAA